MLVKLGDSEYAVGLQWSRLSGAYAAEEMKLISSELGAKYGLVREIDRAGSDIVRQAGLSNDRSDNGKPSAAAMLADVEEQIMLVQEISADSLWLCVVVDGEILPGSDVIVQRTEVKEKLEAMLFSTLEDVDDLMLIAPPGLAQEIGLNGFEEGSFSTIIGETSAAKKHRISKIGGSNKASFLVGGFVLAAGTLWYVMAGSSAEVAPELMVDFGGPIAATIPGLAAQTGPTQAELLEVALQEEIDILTKQFLASAPEHIVSHVNSVQQHQTRRLAGYVLMGMSWTSSSPKQVGYVWGREIEGRAEGLRASLPEALDVGFSADRAQAITVHGIQSWPQRKFTSLLGYLASQKHPIERLTDALSGGRYEWAVSEHKNEGRFEPIAGVVDSTLANVPRLNLPAEGVTIKGSSFARLDALAGLFENYGQTLQISDIKILLFPEQSWEITGVIYESR